MSHTLMPMTKVIVRGGSKAPNDAVWMFSLIAPHSLMSFLFDYSLNQRGDNSESRAGLFPEPRRVLRAQVQCPGPCHDTEVSLRTQGPLRTSASHTGVPAQLPIPAPAEVQPVTKRAAGIVIRCCKLSPLEQYFCVFLCLCQGWETQSSGRQKLAWQAKVFSLIKEEGNNSSDSRA